MYAHVPDKHFIHGDAYSMVMSDLPGGMKYKLIYN